MEQKLIFIDLDGTLSPQFTWFALNLALGITPEEDKTLFDQYIQGTISYKAWNKELVSLYKSKPPVSKEKISSLADTIELRPDAIDTVRMLKEKGYRVVVLSGSVDLIVQAVAQKVGADDALFAARLIFDENETLMNIATSGDEAPAKASLAEEYCAKHGYTFANAYAVEDGGNGVEMFKKAKGILLGSNAELAPFAWKQVSTLSDIPGLL